MPLAIAETTWPVTDLEKGQETPQSTVADLAPLGEELAAPDESVGQGQPIPQLTAAPFTEPALSEPTQPEPEFTDGSVNPLAAAAETTASRDAAQSAAEPLSFSFYDHRTRTDLTATNHSNYHARNDDYSTSGSPCFLTDDAGSTARRCDANCGSVNVLDGDRLDAAYANL